MTTEICKNLEHFETPEWAARAILEKEVLTDQVCDPCVGAGILSEVAEDFGYRTYSFDIHDWGYARTNVADWLTEDRDKVTWVPFHEASCFMNPPFSLATKFVEKAIERKFRKILCFQRFAWYESRARKNFFDQHPPNRVYICGDRAACWRHDIPQEERTSSSPTAHAWFVWDRDAPAGTILGRIYKGDNNG